MGKNSKCCQGATKKVLVEVMPGVLIDQWQVPGFKIRRPRSWKPRIRHRKYKPRAPK